MQNMKALPSNTTRCTAEKSVEIFIDFCHVCLIKGHSNKFQTLKAIAEGSGKALLQFCSTPLWSF